MGFNAFLPESLSVPSGAYFSNAAVLLGCTPEYLGMCISAVICQLCS